MGSITAPCISIASLYMPKLPSCMITGIHSPVLSTTLTDMLCSCDCTAYSGYREVLQPGISALILLSSARSATLKMAAGSGRRRTVTSCGPGHGRPGRGKAKFGNVRSAEEEVRV